MQHPQPIPLNVTPGSYLGPYFIVVPGLNTYGRYGSVVSVESRNGFVRNAVCKIQTSLEDHSREIEVLRIMSTTEGYPTLYDEFSLFTNVSYYLFVISNSGDPLFNVFERSVDPLSNENVCRIGYRLFGIIHNLHTKGYVHRDLHLKNILITKSSDHTLKLTLIDFGFARPSVPAPESRNMISYHASVQVCSGDVYTPMDDLTSIVINLMILSSIDPFGLNTQNYLALKQQFHENPRPHFDGTARRWIAELYLEIQRQRDSGSQHIQLMDIFQNAIPGFDPNTPIEYRMYDFVNFVIA